MSLTRRQTLKGMAAGAAVIAAPKIGLSAEPDIIIGAPNSLTGGLAEGGVRFVAALRIAVDKINAGGGIKSLGGAKLKLMVADTTSENPAQSASVTRRMIDQDKAVIIAGATASAMSMAAQIECEKSQIPFVTNSYADPIVTRGMKYTFKYMPQGSAVWNMAMDGVVDMYKATTGKPPRNCAIFMSNDGVGLSVQKHLPEEAKRIGLPVLFSTGYQMGLSDPSVAIGPIMAQKPDVLFLGAFTNDLILIIQAMRGLGLKTPIMNGGTFYGEAVINALGNKTDYLYGVETWNSDLDLPGNKELVDTYMKANPKAHPGNEQLGVGFTLGLIIAQALEKAASRDGVKIRDVLANTEFTNLPVPAGKVKYGPDGLNIHNMGILVEWQSSVLRTVWPQNLQQAKPML
ncbi:MAG TPA: ABC transporter substrate-binding protein [Stellaceae bacterium]|jgi:branched-chain amino acid transport system substrate-binding protein|nr:ABC transporter substrate-binding protein [Stellaceae bacterium]